MADVLLTHSFFIANDEKQKQKMRPYPPLGTLYIASRLRELGYSIALFDAMLADGMSAFEAQLAAASPRFVVIAEDQFNWLNKMCLQHARNAACHMATLAREAGATVIATGSDISDHPRPYFDHGVQYGIIGEPDHTVVELLGALSKEGDFDPSEIAGLAFPQEGAPLGIKRTRPRAPERHPDVFPMPAWDLFDPEPYRRAWKQAHGYFSVGLVSTRGCPFHCNWCAKPIWGQRYAMRSPDNVAEEMALIKSLIGPDHIWFADDIFGLRPAWVAEFAECVTRRDARIPFMIQSRVDLMSEQAVTALAKAGCDEVWLGVESGSQKILDAMDKGTKVEDIPVARALLKEAGIKACFFLQFGYPGETWSDILATVKLVRECLPDEIGISVSYPLPGTKFFNMVQKQLGDKDHWNQSNDLDMMFQGTYQTPFYRRLHKLLHSELDLRHDLLRAPEDKADNDKTDILARLADVATRWFELGQMERESITVNPTQLGKRHEKLIPPDLSRNYN